MPKRLPKWHETMAKTEWYDTAEMLTLLNEAGEDLSLQGLHYRCRNNLTPAVRVGRSWVFPRIQADQYLYHIKKAHELQAVHEPSLVATNNIPQEENNVNP